MGNFSSYSNYQLVTELIVSVKEKIPYQVAYHSGEQFYNTGAR